jgi:hypothetical protein
MSLTRRVLAVEQRIICCARLISYRAAASMIHNEAGCWERAQGGAVCRWARRAGLAAGAGHRVNAPARLAG